MPALDFADAIYICFSDSIIAVRHSKVLCDLNWFLAMECSKAIVSQFANIMLNLIWKLGCLYVWSDLVFST